MAEGKPPSDESLMLAYSKGNAQAFETLYRRHKNPLYRYFTRQLGSQTQSQNAIAEELFQEVWIKVINAAGTYRPTAKFTTYLYQIAHNVLIDFYRSKDQKTVRQYANSPPDDSDLENNATIDKHSDFTQSLEKEQLFTFLLQLVSLLPAPQREVFLLKEESGLSIEDIANILSENKESIKSRYRYALKKLREGLQAFDPNDTS